MTWCRWTAPSRVSTSPASRSTERPGRCPAAPPGCSRRTTLASRPSWVDAQPQPDGYLGRVSKVPSGPRRLARRLAALSGSPAYAQYAGDPPPCDAPHQTPRASPSGRTTLLSKHALAVLPTEVGDSDHCRVILKWVRAFWPGVDCDICTSNRKALVPHRNAPLTETGRLRLARCVVDDNWSLRRAAERFQVSPTTAQRWVDRYRRLGEAGMADRSSRPRTSPRRTPTRTERRIIKVRILRRWGPARIAHLLHLVPSTVHRVLARYGLARLAHLDRATGRVIRRYERDRPGELVHVDIKKLGNIPTAAATKSSAAPQAARTARTPATATCTPPSTTTPAWPTARSTPTRRRRPPPPSGPAPTPSSSRPASPWNGY